MVLAEINALIKNRAFDRALEFLKSYRRENPGETLALFYEGLCHFELQQFDECVEVLGEVIDQAREGGNESIPSYLYLYLGIAQVRTGFPREAIQNLERARVELEQELSQEGRLSHWTTLQYTLGKAYVQAGEVENGLENVGQVIERFRHEGCPGDPEVARLLFFCYYYAALVYFMVEKYPESRGLLIEGADLLGGYLGQVSGEVRNQFFYPLYILGKSLIILEEFRRGLTMVLQAKKLCNDPEPLLILDYYLARCYFKLGEYPQARRQIDSVTRTIADHELEIDPDYIVNIFFTSGQISLAERNFEQAIKEFQRVRKIDPEMAFLDNLLADLHLLQGDAAAATTLYRQALERDPTDIYTHIRVIQAGIFPRDEAQRSLFFLTSIDFEKSQLPDDIRAILSNPALITSRPGSRPWNEMVIAWMISWEKNLFHYFDDPLE